MLFQPISEIQFYPTMRPSSKSGFCKLLFKLSLAIFSCLYLQLSTSIPICVNQLHFVESRVTYNIVESDNMWFGIGRYPCDLLMGDICWVPKNQSHPMYISLTLLIAKWEGSNISMYIVISKWEGKSDFHHIGLVISNREDKRIFKVEIWLPCLMNLVSSYV